MTLAGLIFEGAVAALLLVAAVLMWRVDTLDDATDRARASMAALQRATRESGEGLEDQVRDARQLADELRLLTSGADRRADAMTRGAPRRPVSDVFPEGGRRTVFSDLKDTR